MKLKDCVYIIFLMILIFSSKSTLPIQENPFVEGDVFIAKAEQTLDTYETQEKKLQDQIDEAKAKGDKYQTRILTSYKDRLTLDKQILETNIKEYVSAADTYLSETSTENQKNTAMQEGLIAKEIIEAKQKLASSFEPNIAQERKTLTSDAIKDFNTLTGKLGFGASKSQRLTDLNTLAAATLNAIANRMELLLTDKTKAKVLRDAIDNKLLYWKNLSQLKPAKQQQLQNAISAALWDFEGKIDSDNPILTKASSAQKENFLNAELRVLQDKYTQIYNAIKKLNPDTKLPETLDVDLILTRFVQS